MKEPRRNEWGHDNMKPTKAKLGRAGLQHLQEMSFTMCPQMLKNVEETLYLSWSLATSSRWFR